MRLFIRSMLCTTAFTNGFVANAAAQTKTILPYDHIHLNERPQKPANGGKRTFQAAAA